MQLRMLASLVLTFFLSLAAAAANERSIDVFAWPISASKPQTLAKVSFTANNASVKSFTAPSIPGSDDIVRVGFYHASGKWSGIATSAGNFAPEKSKKLQLHVRPDGELYHVGFKATDGGVSQGKGASTKDGLSVEVVKIQPGAVPHLNKPVVVSEDGTVEGKEPEKTFLQKYANPERSWETSANITQILVGNRALPSVPGRHGRRWKGVSSNPFNASYSSTLLLLISNISNRRSSAGSSFSEAVPWLKADIRDE